MPEDNPAWSQSDTFSKANPQIPKIPVPFFPPSPTPRCRAILDPSPN